MVLYNFFSFYTSKWHCLYAWEAACDTEPSPCSELLKFELPKPVCPLGEKMTEKKKGDLLALGVCWQQIPLKTTMDYKETDHVLSRKRLLNKRSHSLWEGLCWFFSSCISFLLQSSTVWLLQVIIHMKRAKEIWHLLWAIMHLKGLEHTLGGSSPPHIHREARQMEKDPRVGHVQVHWLKSSLIFLKRRAKMCLF